MPDIETFSVAGLVAPHPLAAAAGRDVLIEGGNVIEAALASAAVSAVTAPDRNGLGGDALWLIRGPGPRGRVRVLDARGTVGALAGLSFYRERHYDALPRHGPEAMLTVPGTVAGWTEAHALSTTLGGRLPLSRLLAPAAAAARDGWTLSERDVVTLAAEASALAAQPDFAAAHLADGRVPAVGTRRADPALAATLDYLIGAGLDDLYRGDVARELSADLAALQSPLTRADLRGAEARWREPRSLGIGRHVFDAPPTRAGMTAAVALGLLVGLGPLKAEGFEHWHGLIESLRAADTLLDGIDSAGEDPASLLDAARLTRESLGIDRARARRAEPPSAPLLMETAAWIGVVDRDGAAVSLVQSLGGAFGAGVVSRRTGLLLGNRGAALTLDPDLGPVLRPGRRAPLRALPALLASRDGAVTAAGATGPRSATALAQLASRFILGLAPGDTLEAACFDLGATPDGRDAAVLIDAEREPPPMNRLRSAGHLLVPEDVGMWDPAGAVVRLASGRVEAAPGSGDAAGF